MRVDPDRGCAENLDRPAVGDVDRSAETGGAACCTYRALASCCPSVAASAANRLSSQCKKPDRVCAALLVANGQRSRIFNGDFAAIAAKATRTAHTFLTGPRIPAKATNALCANRRPASGRDCAEIFDCDRAPAAPCNTAAAFCLLGAIRNVATFTALAPRALHNNAKGGFWTEIVSVSVLSSTENFEIKVVFNGDCAAIATSAAIASGCFLAYSVAACTPAAAMADDCDASVVDRNCSSPSSPWRTKGHIDCAAIAASTTVPDFNVAAFIDLRASHSTRTANAAHTACSSRDRCQQGRS